MKTLLFTDSHRATKEDFRTLLDIGISQKVDDIIFLGDVDGSNSYNELINFKRYCNSSQIDFKAVRGNHDQAWLDYGKGKEKAFIIAKNIVDSGMKDSDILHFINKMNISITEVKRIFYFIGLYKYKVQFRHAFPKGDKISGNSGKNKLRNDHRFKYPDLWYSSFGTGNEIGNGIESYDPNVILKTFRYMNLRLIDYIIKGHEHTNKIWTQVGEDIKGGKIIKPNSGIIFPKKNSIIQIGAFTDGNFALLHRKPFKFGIEFKNNGN